MPKVRILSEAYVVKLFPLVEGMDTVSMANESQDHVVMLIYAMAADIFKVIADQECPLIHGIGILNSTAEVELFHQFGGGSEKKLTRDLGQW